MVRRFGGGVLRGTAAYWADRSDDVDAGLHYHVEHRNGVPTPSITGRCAEFHWPEHVGELKGRIYIATGEVAGLRKDNSRRYQDVQDYSTLVQQFFQVRLDIYIKEVSIPVFGVNHYWYRFEFAKSRGQIHFHMFAINEDKQPQRLLRAIKNGGAQEKADALATWARGSLSLTAMRPAGVPNGELDITLVRAPEGEWAPPKDSNAAGLLLRDAISFREQCIACANSYCFHT